jgi:hypothetical protein
MSTPTFFTCPNCYAWADGAPPHGWGEPCPLAVEVARSQSAMYDAQRRFARDVHRALNVMLGKDDYRRIDPS